MKNWQGVETGNKFQVGDRVRISDAMAAKYREALGSIGIVNQVCGGHGYPITYSMTLVAPRLRSKSFLQLAETELEKEVSTS